MSRAQDEAVERLARAFQGLIPALILDNDRIARSAGISSVDNQVLHALALAGRPLDQSELGEQIDQPSSTVSRAIDRLERAGYVHRARHASDRRRFVVEPVPEQLAGLAERYQPFVAAMAGAGRSFTAGELDTVTRYLTALTEARTPPLARHGEREDGPAR